MIVINQHLEYDLYVFFRKYLQMTDSEISTVIQASVDESNFLDFYKNNIDTFTIDEINKMWSSVISLRIMIERRCI